MGAVPAWSPGWSELVWGAGSGDRALWQRGLVRKRAVVVQPRSQEERRLSR